MGGRFLLIFCLNCMYSQGNLSLIMLVRRKNIRILWDIVGVVISMLLIRVKVLILPIG